MLPLEDTTVAVDALALRKKLIAKKGGKADVVRASDEIGTCVVILDVFNDGGARHCHAQQDLL